VHEYLRTSGVPVLAVWGRADEIFGPAGARHSRPTPSIPRFTLLDGGHFLLESAADEVASLMRRFLARRLAPALRR